MPSADVIDFFWEWQRRRETPQSSPFAELALDKCEEMMRQRDWQGFEFWLQSFQRERRRLAARAAAQD